MALVEMYTVESCPFCAMAKTLLERKSVSYVDHDLSDLPDSELRSYLNTLCGRTTVPQIWIAGRYIGGFTDLHALDASGELAHFIEGSG